MLLLAVFTTVLT